MKLFINNKPLVLNKKSSITITETIPDRLLANQYHSILLAHNVEIPGSYLSGFLFAIKNYINIVDENDLSTVYCLHKIGDISICDGNIISFRGESYTKPKYEDNFSRREKIRSFE